MRARQVFAHAFAKDGPESIAQRRRRRRLSDDFVEKERLRQRIALLRQDALQVPHRHGVFVRGVHRRVHASPERVDPRVLLAVRRRDETTPAATFASARLGALASRRSPHRLGVQRVPERVDGG